MAVHRAVQPTETDRAHAYRAATLICNAAAKTNCAKGIAASAAITSRRDLGNRRLAAGATLGQRRPVVDPGFQHVLSARGRHGKFWCVVSHVHYVLIGSNLFGVLARLYYWFPKFTGKMLDERLGKVNFWLTFIGFNVAFFTMQITGLMGCRAASILISRSRMGRSQSRYDDRQFHPGRGHSGAGRQRRLQPAPRS